MKKRKSGWSTYQKNKMSERMKKYWAKKRIARQVKLFVDKETQTYFVKSGDTLRQLTPVS